MITDADLDNWFTYHPPRDDIDVLRYQTIREAGRTFASVIVEHTPSSADQSAAIRLIREAVWTANAAIACDRPETAGHDPAVWTGNPA